MMARVLTSAEIHEICDLLIPIIRGEGPYSLDQIKHAANVIDDNKRRARGIWRLIIYEDYAGELL
jgi:hypothetical protein